MEDICRQFLYDHDVERFVDQIDSLIKNENIHTEDILDRCHWIVKTFSNFDSFLNRKPFGITDLRCQTQYLLHNLENIEDHDG